MIIYEYNEAETMEMFKKEAYEEGHDNLLITQVCRKLKRTVDLEQISKELEVKASDIKDIYDFALSFGPDYDENKAIDAYSRRAQKTSGDNSGAELMECAVATVHI